MNDNRITKRVFMWDHELFNNNWCSDIFYILSSANLDNLFRNLLYCSTCELKSKEIYLSDITWGNGIMHTSKLRTYVTFKTSSGTEQYVLMNLKRDERSLLSKLRLEILPLRIETGRFYQESLDKRSCEFCNLDK